MIHEIDFEAIGLAFGADYLRKGLAELLAKTAHAKDFARGGFMGSADYRQVLDNGKAGRLAVNAAHRQAEHGLAALDLGDLGGAASALRLAESFYVGALETVLARSRVRKDRRKAGADLSTSAQRRGRKPGANAERNRRLAEAVGSEYSLANAKAAVEDNPWLREAFKGMTGRTLYNAYQSGKKLGN